MVSNDCKEKCRDFGMLVENIICMADCYEEPIEKFRKSMFYKPEFEDKEKIILEVFVFIQVKLYNVFKCFAISKRSVSCCFFKLTDKVR